MRLVITIDIDNAAFEIDETDATDQRSGCEVARIIRKLANDIDGDTLVIDSEYSLFDINGNKVGTAEVRE